MKYQKGTFLIVPNKEVMKGSSPITQTVYFWICNFADNNGECFPSLTTLAGCAGCAKNTVLKAIEELEKMGLLVKVKRYKNNEQITNLYQIMVLETAGSGASHEPGGASGEPPSAGDEPRGGAGDGHRTQSTFLTQSTKLKSSKEDRKPEFGNPSVNDLIKEIKKTCSGLDIAYDNDQERNFAKHILTAREFAEFAKKLGKSPCQVAIAILKASVQMNFRKGYASGPRKIYKWYAEIYNAWKKTESKESPVLSSPTL